MPLWKGRQYCSQGIILHAYLSLPGTVSEPFAIHSKKAILLTLIVEHGKITALEAKRHPNKNIITRAVGVSREILVDFSEQEMKDGDVLLLCTDGLTNFVESDEMCDLTKDDMFYEFAERLVDRANKNGGGDNVTVVAVTY